TRIPEYVRTDAPAGKTQTVDHLIRVRILELRLGFPAGSCALSLSEVESQGCSYGIHMLCFRTAVVLPHKVKIENDLALGQQHFSKWTTPQRLVKADGKTV